VLVGSNCLSFKYFFKVLIGALFGYGLCVSGMVKRSKIGGFLTIYDNWDR